MEERECRGNECKYRYDRCVWICGVVGVGWVNYGHWIRYRERESKSRCI